MPIASKENPVPSFTQDEYGVFKLLLVDATDVYGYWKARFGKFPSDGTLRELPVDSGCGVPCVAAIDAAALLVLHMRAAGNSEQIDGVLEACLTAVRIYWHG